MTTSLTKHGITKYSPQAIERLHANEARIIHFSVPTKENPRIDELNEKQMLSAISAIQVKAKVKLGHTSSDKGKLATESEQQVISEDLVDKFPSLTVRELYMAVDNGLDGNYQNCQKENIFFNPSNLVKWIRAYIDEIKRPAIVKADIAQDRVDKEAIKEEIGGEYERMVNIYKRLVNTLADIEEGRIPMEDYGGWIYDFLLQFDLIQPVEAGSIEMEAAALQMLDQGMATGNRGDINMARRFTESVKEGKMEEPVFALARRRQVAKRLQEIGKWEADDILDFLESLKIAMIDYFKENNLTPAKP